MVRPDESRKTHTAVRGPCVSRCIEPAGASPVPVGVGAPGSRSQAWGEIPVARAGCRKPFRGEQVRGPQHQVNTAASTERQSGGRAAHVTAKAIPDALVPKRASGPGGVWVVARAHGSVRNRRGPSQPPLSRQGVSYKSMAKSSAAERKSEGTVVPLMPVQQNAGGGKGPCLGHATGGGKCGGMTGPVSRSNHPVGENPDHKARRLRRKLWGEAKPLPERRTRFGGSGGCDAPRVILRRTRREKA